MQSKMLILPAILAFAITGAYARGGIMHRNACFGNNGKIGDCEIGEVIYGNFPTANEIRSLTCKKDNDPCEASTTCGGMGFCKTYIKCPE
ncbi:hypothetical protein PG996_004976 [Apiospora saccharicola]|uniref:Uncharacterized protein n=1 Tax=Apiospora saccharicola TaxID=335842 RepID=A0ABR1VP67_9PEZI